MIKTYSGSQKVFGACLVFLLLLFSGCEKRTGSSNNKMTTPQTVAKLDACSLITREEFRAIQNSTVTEIKSSANANGGFRIAQCFFGATSNNSVSLAVTQSDPDSSAKRSPTDYWKETFGRYTAEEKERDDDKVRDQARAKGEEEEHAPPKKISGIGDEAFWSGSLVGGALYILKKEKDVFIRISVGGADNEETKINKSKALAQKAIERL